MQSGWQHATLGFRPSEKLCGLNTASFPCAQFTCLRHRFKSCVLFYQVWSVRESVYGEPARLRLSTFLESLLTFHLLPRQAFPCPVS